LGALGNKIFDKKTLQGKNHFIQNITTYTTVVMGGPLFFLPGMEVSSFYISANPLCGKTNLLRYEP
jgi:hypothetical protein